MLEPITTRVYARTTYASLKKEAGEERREERERQTERKREKERDATKPWKERRGRSKYCRDRYIQRSRPDSALNLARNPRLHSLMI